jgi:hypothetical protein
MTSPRQIFRPLILLLKPKCSILSTVFAVARTIWLWRYEPVSRQPTALAMNTIRIKNFFSGRNILVQNHVEVAKNSLILALPRLQNHFQVGIHMRCAVVIQKISDWD